MTADQARDPMMHQVDTIETHVRPGLYLLGNAVVAINPRLGIPRH